MEITCVYNAPVLLEDGDLIAVDTKKRWLWIRDADKLYKSCDTIDNIDLEKRIYVNSAGYYTRHYKLLPAMVWVKYHSNVSYYFLLMKTV